MLYLSQFLRIYLWQALAMACNLVSVLIVVPAISADARVFGIYTIVNSIALYLGYADLGVVNAGSKLAADAHVAGDRPREAAILGFVVFVLACGVSLFAIFAAIASFRPAILSHDLQNAQSSSIAAALLRISLLNALTVIAQRVNSIIYGIRLKQYTIQRVEVGLHLSKLALVPVFFGASEYNVVGYYGYCMAANFVAAVTMTAVGVSRFGIPGGALLRGIRFDREIFRRAAGLTLNGIFLMLAWILYYELDALYIGKLFGVREAGIYTAAFTVLSLCRTLLTILFSPLNTRLIYFHQSKTAKPERDYLVYVCRLTLPLIVIPIVAGYLLMPQLIPAWLGGTYVDSIPIARMLILCNALAFIAYPVSAWLFVNERLKDSYVAAALALIAFGIVAVTGMQWLGYRVFAAAKLTAFVVMGAFYLRMAFTHLAVSVGAMWQYFVRPLLAPLLALGAVFVLWSRFGPHELPKLYLVGGEAVVLVAVAFAVVLTQSSFYRAEVSRVIGALGRA